MEKNCLNCKYYYNHVCNNKSIQLEEVERSNNGVTYIEDKKELVKENFNVKQMSSLIMKELSDRCTLKNKEDMDKLNLDDIISEIAKITRDICGYSMLKYLINNSNEFSCCYWE